jgi:hypothetical protein
VSHNIFEDGLGYEGKVTLTLKNNNRVLKTHTYKNNGTAHLFKFLGHCLIGHYSDVENLLPTKIALLFNGASTPSAADPSRAESSVSDFIGMAQTPSIVSTNNPAEVKVTYSFEVARSKITGKFNQVALYGAGVAQHELENFSAYYLLADSAKNDFEIEDPEQWSDTTVLLIDWELSLSNKNVGTNNN